MHLNIKLNRDSNDDNDNKDNNDDNDNRDSNCDEYNYNYDVTLQY
jgi:hypothetical protein